MRCTGCVSASPAPVSAISEHEGRVGPVVTGPSRIGRYHGRVARWAGDAGERLEAAALALFVEQGFDRTSVAQIAERAGLTRSTFFRHFADKREVVLGGRDLLANLLADAVRAADPAASVLECLEQSYRRTGEVAFTPARRELAVQRRRAVEGSSELQERELLKRARVVSAVAAAFEERGCDPTTARLAAELGQLAFSAAFQSWTDDGNDEPFAEVATATLRDMARRASAVTGAGPATAP